MTAQGIIGADGGVGGESKGDGGSSICPTGWRIPVGVLGESNDINTYNEWAMLNNAFATNGTNITPNPNWGTGFFQNWQPNATSGGNAIWQSGFGTVSAGQFYPGDGLFAQSTVAYLWTSSVSDGAHGAIAFISNTSVFPGTTGNEISPNIGNPVRCVFP